MAMNCAYIQLGKESVVICGHQTETPTCERPEWLPNLLEGFAQGGDRRGIQLQILLASLQKGREFDVRHRRL